MRIAVHIGLDQLLPVYCRENKFSLADVANKNIYGIIGCTLHLTYFPLGRNCEMNEIID